MNHTDTATAKHRRIRSYVLRTGRITAGQQRALNDLWPVYGIDICQGVLCLEALFGNQAPVTLEIGFGNGDNLIDMATNSPTANFIGAEVHEPGVGHCLMKIDERKLGNVRITRQDAVEFMIQKLADASLARVNLFFPDPWHKKRHHKRRIVQPQFLQLLELKLRPDGIFHVATDWPDYAEHIAATVAASTSFVAMREYPADRITTKFDVRGQRLGHRNWESAWRRCNKLSNANRPEYKKAAEE